MENISNFVFSHEKLIFILWLSVGFILFWIGAFIKQVFYWKKKGRVAMMFDALREKWDWINNLTISILFASWMGIVGLIWIYWAIEEVLNESERLHIIDS